MSASYPLAAVLYYGPDEQTASRCVITVYASAGVELVSRAWEKGDGDIRRDAALADEMVAFVRLHGAVCIVFGDGVELARE